ncbi:MAG: TetR/AcrR family transcriptional regulator [Eubacteriales bacterium]|nr:TetR/AcrR family transcriptional regulator [Eubacteriales bacterium]
MEEKVDLRVQKTYDALFLAFQELITEKTFDKITVRELCSRARTRPATFYSHFSDKYDFFAFMIRQMKQEYLKQSEQVAMEMGPETYIPCMIRFALDFLEEYEDFICAVEADSMLVPTLDLITKELNEQVKQHLKIIEGRGNELAADPEILAELFAGAVMQVAKWWFTHRKEISKEELTEQLLEILPRMIFK